ncbi:MAG: response regulator transcription factor [Dehalococcoidia bacterium]|jgi:DNA-binding NarL/FixJ family response regulator
MIKILIADDHPVVRQGLRQILADIPDMIVEGEAGDGYEVLDKVKQGDYDLVLLDISMPKLNGIDILNIWEHEGRRRPKVLVLSIYPEEQYAIRALKAGALGYVTKNMAPSELVTAIRKVAVGERYVSSTLAEKLASYLTADRNKLLHESLSNRELQVLTMIAKGKTVKEISAELSLSIKTVSTYRARLLEKMQLKNNAQIMQYAMQNHLLEE